MPTDYTVVGLLVGAVGALFALYQRGVAQTLAAKDAEIAWLRGQLGAWTDIGRSAVATAEHLTGTRT